MSVQASELVLSVTDIDVKKGGDIVVYLYEGEKGFPKVHEDAKFQQRKKASLAVVEFSFTVPKEIEGLAVKVHHDINEDGKVTKNWTGIIPKDGLGFSKEQSISLMGLPKYEKTKLSVDDFAKKQTIKIKYYAE